MQAPSITNFGSTAPQFAQQQGFQQQGLQQRGFHHQVLQQQTAQAPAFAGMGFTPASTRDSVNENHPPKVTSRMPVFERDAALRSSIWASDSKETSSSTSNSGSGGNKRSGISSTYGPAGVTTRSSTSVQLRPLSGEISKDSMPKISSSLTNNWYK
ncbi:hypothetical protein Slin15195_G003440 [Septoria linicola]|uniref:Uncharacterized protein n=1 Tax=Septoria linicola TaxID=215465 RepID=A0A9Q9EDP5_9PEZI|nr:hypothetical protein Slin14017_G003470 [Septoria linicola]USW47025.1 hypothetical protein Slin15195_G003440 [Septoria linicola]